MQARSKAQLSLLLPQLQQECDIRASDQEGKWDTHSFKAFGDVAASLDYKSPGQIQQVSSVPTMWAVPLSLEMALHQRAYPIRAELVERWQGMLAAIALAEVRGFPLKAKLLELEELRYENFARSLTDLLPDEVNALYTLEGGKHSWQDIYVFSWNGSPVGMTSPSTLVCPSAEAQWGELPWWQNGQLRSPHDFISPDEKDLLWRWLENLRRELGSHNGKRSAVNTIGNLIDEFRSSLVSRPPEMALSLSEDPEFFGVPLNRGVLRALNRPVKVQPKPSNVRIVPSLNKANVPDLLLIDPQIARDWNISPQNIWVNEGKTLASLKIEDLRSKKIIWKDVRCVEPQDLFLPGFSFIDQEEALPGALPIREVQPLAIEGERITPLVPLDPMLLDYFSPEDLASRIQLQPIASETGTKVRVILDLPLAGTNNGNPATNYRIYKDYPLEPENALPGVPVLEIWPHFQTDNWKEYYAFYFNEYGDEIFQVTLPNLSSQKPLEDGGTIAHVTQMREFPSHINCFDATKKALGLILLKSPPRSKRSGSWTVGVDFGTSFTNIYVNDGSGAKPLSLNNLLLKVTDSSTEVRIPVLVDYFIPDRFFPEKKPLPLSTVVSTKGIADDGNQQPQPLLEGRIYVPDRSNFDPRQRWIKSNLKWAIPNLRFNQLFLRHLALHVSALAADDGATAIQWALSYPSAFSPKDKRQYNKIWRDTIEQLQSTTGIQHRCPEIDDLEYFRTESLAVAQYFAEHEDYDLVNTTCIDVGGGTSDISIWEKNRLVHQCSVQLAGRDIFGQFLAKNPRFQDRLFEGVSYLKGLQGAEFNAKLDVWLRVDSRDWLQSKRAFIEDDPDFQGLTRLTAIGIAGLYYYVGILLKALHEEGKYSLSEITPVYMGGNASQFLNWLDERGTFDRHSELNDLLSWMMSKGSGFENTDEKTQLSQKPKDEVACGLVLKDKKLEGLKRKDKDPLIAGERCQVNGEEVSGLDRLRFEEDISEFKIPQLVEIPKFLYEFHTAIREIEIEGIRPLPGYTRSLEISANSGLWRDVNRKLTALLEEMKGKSENIRVEPPFILALKALLLVLGDQWAQKK